MAVRHKDVAIGGNGDFRWLIERVEPRAGNTGLSERQKNLAILIEFENLLAFAVLDAVVGNPEVAVAVHTNLVGTDEESPAKAFDELSGRFEFQDRIERGAGAVCAARTERATTIDGPDVSIGTQGDAGSRAPFSAVRELAPAHARKIGIGKIVARA